MSIQNGECWTEDSDGPFSMVPHMRLALKFEIWNIAVRDPFGESLIFCLKIPFGDLCSKIISKSSSDTFIFGNW